MMSIRSKARRDAKKRKEIREGPRRALALAAEGLAGPINRLASEFSDGTTVLRNLRRAVAIAEERGLRLNPTSRIPAYLKAIEELLALRTEQMSTADAARFLTALREGWVLGDTVGQLAQAPEVAGWLGHFEKAAKGSYSSTPGSDDTARNFLAELYAASLVRKVGLPVELVEPDLMARFEGRRVAVAVKRPQTEEGAVRKLREGVRQVRACGVPGIVLLDMTAAIAERGGFWRLDSMDGTEQVTVDIKARVRNVLGNADEIVAEVEGHQFVGGIATVVHTALLNQQDAQPIMLRPWMWASLPGSSRAARARRFLTYMMQRTT